MSEDGSYDVNRRIREKLAESQREGASDAARERAKWERCNTPQPLQREDAGPSQRILPTGRSARR
jgi:hypothetical protein